MKLICCFLFNTLWLNLHSYTKTISAHHCMISRSISLRKEKIVVEVKKLVEKMRIHQVYAQLFFMKLPVWHDSALDESDSFYDFTKYFNHTYFEKKLNLVEIRTFECKIQKCYFCGLTLSLTWFCIGRVW